MITPEMIEAAANAHEAEFERWTFRRKMDKSGWEAVREFDITAPISEENMTVFDLGKDKDDAENEFHNRRRTAAAEAALSAALAET